MNAHLFAQTPHPSFIFCDWARLSDAALPAPILILLLPSHCSRLGVVKVLRKTLQQENCHVPVCLAPIHLDLMISMKNRKITFTWLKKVSVFNTMCHHKELYKNYSPTFPPNSLQSLCHSLAMPAHSHLSMTFIGSFRPNTK